MEQDYDQLTHNSRNIIFRFSHQSRLALGNRIIDPKPDENILDFGGGDGFLVGGLAPRSPSTNYTILEPFLVPKLALQNERVKWAKDARELGDTKFDKILCLEVLEHLSPQALDEVMPLFRERLKPGGKCIISMPLEVGPPALWKNAVRFAARRTHANTTLGRVLRSAVFDTDGIPRPVVGGFVPSHMGFDAFKMLDRVLRETGFRVERKLTSPLGALPWFMNSQIYFVLRS